MKIYENFVSSVVKVTCVFLYSKRRRLNIYKGDTCKRIMTNKTSCLSLLKEIMLLKYKKDTVQQVYLRNNRYTAFAEILLCT
jgi:hypothetical protein